MGSLSSNLRIGLIAVICLTSTMFARDKTDVLVMKNGDRITCEVKRLEGGILEAGLDYVDGTIAIDWQKVARIESSHLFLVQLEDGSIFAGKVVTPEDLATAPVKIEIEQVGALKPVEVAHEEIVRLTQTSVSFLHRFNGSLALGSQYAKGNSTTQYNVASDLEYEETRWASKVSYNSNLSSSAGADTATRNQIDLSAYRLLRWKNYFYAGSAGYLQSSVQGIQSQIAVGLGVGAFLKNTNRLKLTVLGAPGWQRTRYVPTASDQSTQDIGVFVISSSLEAFRFKKTRLAATANLMPALTEPGRVFFRANMTYYLKLFGKFDWNFSSYGNWDNRPPGQLSKSDYGSSTGISWSFGNH